MIPCLGSFCLGISYYFPEINPLTYMKAKQTLINSLKEHRLPIKVWYSRVYLRSSHWRELKLRKFEQVGRKCEVCGTASNLEVHHIRYKRIYNVDLCDLQVLCEKHHNLKHSPLEHKFITGPPKSKITKKPFEPKPYEEKEKSLLSKLEYIEQSIHRMGDNRSCDGYLLLLEDKDMISRHLTELRAKIIPSPHRDFLNKIKDKVKRTRA